VNGPVTFFKGWKAKSKSEAKLNPRLFDVTEPLPRKAMPKPKIKTVEKVDLYYCKYCKVFLSCSRLNHAHQSADNHD
jgi:hypothetical protein